MKITRILFNQTNVPVPFASPVANAKSVTQASFLVIHPDWETWLSDGCVFVRTKVRLEAFPLSRVLKIELEEHTLTVDPMLASESEPKRGPGRPRKEVA